MSLCTRPDDLPVIGPFYARIHTPVGKEHEVRWDDASRMTCPRPLQSDWKVWYSTTASRRDLPTAVCNSLAWKSHAFRGSTGEAFSPPGSSWAA